MNRLLNTSLCLIASASVASTQDNFLVTPGFAIDSLSATDIDSGDLFGSDVDIDGSRIVIAAKGHQQDGLATGGVWVRERDAGGVWSVEQKLMSASLPLSASYAQSVAIGGDTILVGADALSDNGFLSGAVYVFERQTDGTWVETQTLFASDIASFWEFGYSVSVDGSFAAVGAPGAKTSTSGGARPGAVYVFERLPSGTWTEIAKVSGEDIFDSWDRGFDVEIAGDRLILGAPLANDNGTLSGAAYIFERQGDGSWAQASKLLPADGDSSDRFGYSVSIDGDYAVAGAWSDEDFSGSGSAYIFERQAGGTWIETTKISHPAAVGGERFGLDVRMSGSAALVSSPIDTVDFDLEQGTVHLFVRDALGNWPYTDSFTVEDDPGDDNFGSGIGMSNGWIAVGCSEFDDPLFDSGTVHLFYSYAASPAAPPAVQGTGTPGCNGPQTLSLDGPALIQSQNLELVCDNAPASAFGYLLVGDAADVAGNDILNLGVLAHLDFFSTSFLVILPMISDASGVGTAAFPIGSQPALVGYTLETQVIWPWTSCALPPLNLSSSALLSITFQAP